MLVPPKIRKCVVFLAIKDQKGLRLIGTGFFVFKHHEETSSTLCFDTAFLISARHVVEKGIDGSVDKKIYIRINSIDGSAEWVTSEASQWHFNPEDSSVDVAALPWLPPADKFDCLFIPESMAATKEVIEKESIGPGDEVFLTGLFTNHFGKERNIPIIRIGNIAAMPEEKIETDFGEIDAYLIEARSIGGLSGSPVFAHLTGVRKGSLSLGIEPIFWLGLMHGHWDAQVRKDDTFDVDQFAKEKVNMGIAIVVPVAKILETLNQEEFRKQSEKLATKYKKDIPPNAD